MTNHHQDYRQSVVECDHMQYVSLRLSAIELRNHYATLFDVVFKNIDKILQPKNEGGMQHIY